MVTLKAETHVPNSIRTCTRTAAGVCRRSLLLRTPRAALSQTNPIRRGVGARSAGPPAFSPTIRKKRNEPNSASCALQLAPRPVAQTNPFYSQPSQKEPLTPLTKRTQFPTGRPFRASSRNGPGPAGPSSFFPLDRVIAICNILITDCDMRLGEKLRYLREVEGTLRGLEPRTLPAGAGSAGAEGDWEIHQPELPFADSKAARGRI